LSESERAQVSEALREMSRDARGNLDSAASSANSNTSNSNASNSNGSNSNARANANSGSKSNANNRNGAESRNVTRTIKGRKEAVIEIAALKGKGYPAPVNLDAGGSKPEPASDSPRTPGTPASGKKGR